MWEKNGFFLKVHDHEFSESSFHLFLGQKEFFLSLGLLKTLELILSSSFQKPGSALKDMVAISMVGRVVITLPQS